MPSLMIQTGKHHGKKITFPPDGKILIGRDPECQVRLASTEVSRQHCLIQLIDNVVHVKDLGSRNGTFIDGYLASGSTVLKPGSVVKTGPMEFLLPGAKASAKKPQQEDDASDDDISAWLTEEGETDNVNMSDSTIITNKKKEAPPPEPVDSLDTHPHAREAAEIIRQYWQSKQQL